MNEHFSWDSLELTSKSHFNPVYTDSNSKTEQVNPLCPHSAKVLVFCKWTMTTRQVNEHTKPYAHQTTETAFWMYIFVMSLPGSLQDQKLLQTRLMS